MNETLYTADPPRHTAAMAAELFGSRELILRMALRDLQARFGKSLLSYFWLLFVPAIAVAIPLLLVARRVVPMNDTPLPYAAFVLVNFVLWQLFSATLQSCATSLNRAGNLVTRVNFPKAALVFAAAGQPLAEFLVKLPLVAIVFVWMGISVPWQVVLAAVLVVPLLLMAIGAGFLLALVGLVVRDVNHALGPVLMALMFLSPVLYPPPASAPFAILNVVNPLSPILTAQQHLLASGTVPDGGMLSAACVFSAALFAFGWRTFHVAMPRLAERA